MATGIGFAIGAVASLLAGGSPPSAGASSASVFSYWGSSGGRLGILEPLFSIGWIVAISIVMARRVTTPSPSTA